jgi:hypothetical protein
VRYVGEGALPSDIRLTAITPTVFDEYFTGWKPDRKAHCGSLASHIEDFGGQTRLGVVMCAFDNPDGASRGGRTLSEYGNRRCDWQSGSSRCQMQEHAAGKFHLRLPRAIGYEDSYSALMPASLMIGHHFSISAF